MVLDFSINFFLKTKNKTKQYKKNRKFNYLLHTKKTNNTNKLI